MNSKFEDILQVKSLGRVGYISIVGLVSIVFFFVFSNQTLAASKLLNSETELVRLTNEIRAEVGVSSLTINQTLARSAQAKAYDMAVNGYFAHEDKLGRRVSYWLKNNGYSYLRAGENLARGFDDPLKLVNAWKRSDSHYSNLINKNYTEIGIGIAEGVMYGKPAIFVVQHFGEPFPLPTLTMTSPVQANILGDVVLQSLSEPMLRDLPKDFSPEIGPAYQADAAAITNESLIGAFLVASSDAAQASAVTLNDTDSLEYSSRYIVLYRESGQVLVKAIFMLLIVLAVWFQSREWHRVAKTWFVNFTK